MNATAEPITKTHPDTSVSTVQRRWREAGLPGGNTGGWLRLPNGTNVQGWEDVIAWAKRRLAYVSEENLREIVEGRRHGIPTLCRDLSTELAAGLLSPTMVSWRNKPAKAA